MAGNTIAVMTVLLLSLSVLQTMGEGERLIIMYFLHALCN